MTDNINPWRYVARRDVSNNPYFKEVKTEENQGNSIPEDNTIPDKSVHSILSGQYNITDRFDTYAKGVEFIRSITISKDYKQPIFVKSDKSKIYRPLTTLESLEVMVDDYNRLQENGKDRTPEDRERLFNNYKFTCTGVAYKKGGGEIKIIPQSTDLIIIPESHNTNFWSIDYSNIKGTKLDTSKAKYNTGLTKSEVLAHPAWLNAVEGNKKVLEEYANIVFNMLATKKNSIKGMGFYIINKPDADQLRALCVISLDGYSFAGGIYDLNVDARFLLVAPSQKKSPKK